MADVYSVSTTLCLNVVRKLYQAELPPVIRPNLYRMKIVDLCVSYVRY